MSTSIPAHDSGAERSILGACLLASECWQVASDLLIAGDFYEPRHQLIWAALAALTDGGEPLDTTTLRGALGLAGTLQRAGGDEYLLALTDTIPHVPNVEAYALRVRELATVRLAGEAAARIAAEAATHIDDVAGFLDRAETALAQACSRRMVGGDAVPMTQAIDELFERIQAQAERGGSVGNPTGITKLDKYLGGMMPGELAVLAGRPGMGKTALALKLAQGVATRTGKPVLFQSVEMPRVQLVMRLLAAEGKIDGQRLREVKFNQDDWHAAERAAGRLRNLGVWIDDSAGVTILDVRRTARRLQQRKGQLGLVVIDYLQLLRPARWTPSREEQVAEMSRSAKALAKELDIPVLALASMNRDADKRGAKDHRPQLSDLRESGAIESDADTVLFIYRDEVYNKDTADQGIAEIIIGKQRNGPTGTVKAIFKREFTSFENLEERQDNDHWSDA